MRRVIKGDKQLFNLIWGGPFESRRMHGCPCEICWWGEYLLWKDKYNLSLIQFICYTSYLLHNLFVKKLCVNKFFCNTILSMNLNIFFIILNCIYGLFACGLFVIVGILYSYMLTISCLYINYLFVNFQYINYQCVNWISPIYQLLIYAVVYSPIATHSADYKW